MRNGRDWKLGQKSKWLMRSPRLAGILCLCLVAGCGTTLEKHPGKAVPDPWAVFAVPRMPSVVIDGDVADWADGGFRVGALIPDQGPVPVPKEFAAGMRLGWNDSGLLVLLDVTGSDWLEAEKESELYGSDSVEFYLTQHPGAEDRCQWVIAPGMDVRFAEPRVYLQPIGTTPRLRQNEAKPAVARKKTATGYQMEVLLPWRSLGMKPARGDEVAFQIMVNSHARAPRPSDHLLWFPMTGAAFDGRKMHRIRLDEKPSAPVTARARVRVNYREFRTDCDVLAPAAAAGQAVRLRSEHSGVLATGTLSAAAGAAYAVLSGPMTREPVVYLDVDGRGADVIPLLLPRAEMAIETRVRMETSSSSTLTAVLGLPDAPAPGYRVTRRLPGESWKVLAENAPPGEFRDRSLKQGTIYEYGLSRGPVGEFFDRMLTNAPSTDYFWAGSGIPARDRRGTVLLIVERSLAAPLAAELSRLTQDLVGDGWQVSRHDVASNQAPAEIKQWIRAEYDRAPTEVNTVLLLGHVPVFRAGHDRPDRHGKGTSPADVYYGVMDGVWSNLTANVATDLAGEARTGREREDVMRVRNEIPGRVQLAVGRVDFANMPAFKVDETTLLRGYLNRDHAYRHARLPVTARALIHDSFFGQQERFAYTGWQNFTTLVGPESVQSVTWPNITPAVDLLFCGCGSGYATSMSGFGDTRSLVSTPLEVVFAMMFGSVFMDWDTQDNFLRATLGHARGALACGWAGRPHWYLHSMGMGESIGDCLRRTQNNDGSDYRPVGLCARGVHIALLGDPTLRLHQVAPPTGLSAQRTGSGVHLSWAADRHQKATGYHVYRASSELGPYERLSRDLVTGLAFDDPNGGTADHYYQVRAVLLQETPTGSYYNNSQGVFCRTAPAP